MKHRADVFFLPGTTQSMFPSDADSFGINAGRLHEDKTDFFCLGGQVKKTFNHAWLVTAVTDIDYLALLMFRYSASSSEARQALLPEKLELIRAGGASISGRPPRVIRSRMAAKSASSKRPHRGQGTSTFRPYFVQLSQRRFMELHYLKTATAPFRVHLLPAVNAFNQ